MNCLLWTSVTVLSLIWAVGGQSTGSLRLVGSFSRTGGSSGRLEVYYNGRWGTVCDDSFGINDARVACRQLGFSSYSRYGTVGRLGFSQASLSTRIWLDELRCRGSESRLINCPANPIGDEDCTHSKDVALVCTARTTSPSSGDLRLVGNSGRTGGSSGRLEFYYNGQWGTVCNDSFGASDARVACRQLGYSSTSIQYGTVETLGFSTASSTTRTWLDELRCSGSESRLINCPASPIGVEDCTHSEDVALICTTGSVSTVSISIGVTIPVIIIVVVIVVLFSGFARKRRRLANYPRYASVISNVTSTVSGSNTQDTYPLQPPIDQNSQYSNQAPPPNIHAPQPAAAYPTGQYAGPQYPTSYPQQPPASYVTAQYPTEKNPQHI